MTIFSFFPPLLVPLLSLPLAHTSPLCLLLVEITLRKLIHWFRVHVWAPLARFQETLSSRQPSEVCRCSEKSPGHGREQAPKEGFQSCVSPTMSVGQNCLSHLPVPYTQPQRVYFILPAVQCIVFSRLSVYELPRALLSYFSDACFVHRLWFKDFLLLLLFTADNFLGVFLFLWGSKLPISKEPENANIKWEKLTFIIRD